MLFTVFKYECLFSLNEVISQQKALDIIQRGSVSTSVSSEVSIRSNFKQFPNQISTSDTCAIFVITWSFDRSLSSWMAQLDVCSYCFHAERSFTPATGRQNEHNRLTKHEWALLNTHPFSCLNHSFERHTVESETTICEMPFHFFFLSWLCSTGT